MQGSTLYKYGECTGDKHYKLSKGDVQGTDTQDQFTIQVLIKQITVHRIKYVQGWN